jgi:hypothetical protein
MSARWVITRKCVESGGISGIVGASQRERRWLADGNVRWSSLAPQPFCSAIGYVDGQILRLDGVTALPTRSRSQPAIGGPR